MPFDPRITERFAMHAASVDRETNIVPGPVEIDVVSAALGLSREDGRAVANNLQRLEWAKLDFRSDKPTMLITPLGYREIEKLLWPAWKRVLYDPKVTFIIGIFAAKAFDLAYLVLKRWLGYE